MADVTLSMLQLKEKDYLPAFCIRCGKTSRGLRRLLLGRLSGLLDVVALAFEKDLFIKVPVCWWHKWIVPPVISITSVQEDRVTISGVSDRFVQAVKLHEQAGSPSRESS